MYTRIVAATDGSPASAHAIEHAIALARALSAKLRIVHAVDMGWLPAGAELAIDTGAAARTRSAVGENLLAAAAEAARAQGFAAEVRLVETVTPTQRVAEAIAEEAAAWPADLVVVGTHGGEGMHGLLGGSVAEGVASFSSVPVLLVPAQGQPAAT